MSSLAPAPSGAAPEPARAALPPRLSPDALTAVGLAGVLAIVAFITTGGTTLAPNTWVEIGLVCLGAAAGAAVTVRSRAPSRHGLGTLLAFGALSALTAVSIAWSLVPDQSWIEANRQIAYLAAFGIALASVRLYPGRWRAVLAGLALLTVALSTWALATKILPGAFDRVDLYGRLRAPFDYWNATGLTAATGIPALVWAGARREASRLTRTLAVPSIAALLVTVVLTSSRSAMLAGLAGLAVWFWLVPLRLRGALVLAAGAVAAVAPAVWALSHQALTHDGVPLGPRERAGWPFGVVAVTALLAGALLTWWAAPAVDRLPLTSGLRRRIGIALLLLVGLVPVGLLAGAAASPRGFSGEVSHVWREVTNSNGGAGDTPGRVVAFGNSRALYWGEGFQVGRHHPLAGVGAAGFATVRTRYTLNRGLVAHVHSFPIETFADLGVLGVLVSLGLLVVWGRATARTFGRGREAPALGVQERVGLLTLLALVVVFGVQSSVDWTWEIPGTALPALLCAAWLAGRAPTGDRVVRARGGAVTAPVLAGLAAVALLAAWAIWQPLRSTDSVTAAQDALVAGNGSRALTDARRAAAQDPLSPTPLWTEADIYTAAGRPAEARQALRAAVSLQSQNPEVWRRLAQFDLAHHNPQTVADLERVVLLDPADSSATLELQLARAAR